MSITANHTTHFDASVDLLQILQPSVLAGLKRQYPAYSNYLEPGCELEETSKPELLFDQMRLDLSLATMREASSDAAALQKHLQMEVRKSNRIGLVSKLTSALIASSLLATVLSDTGQKKTLLIIEAGIALLVSLLDIFSNYIRLTKSNLDIETTATELADLLARSRFLLPELSFYDVHTELISNSWERFNKLIGEANEVSKQMYALLDNTFFKPVRSGKESVNTKTIL